MLSILRSTLNLAWETATDLVCGVAPLLLTCAAYLSLFLVPLYILFRVAL